MAQKKFIIDGGFSTNAESTITGNLLMTGSIIPSVDSNGVTGYDLGSATAKWRDLYLSQGSLYIDGQKVLQSDSGTIVVSADVDQSLLTKTTGAGVLTFQSPNPISISGTLQMGTGKRITSADGLAVVFGDKIDMDANQIINVANPTTAQGVATKDYVDVQIGNILNGAPDALNTLNELAAALGDDANFSATVTNALALKAATTYVDSQDTATLNAAKAYSDGLAFGTGSDLSATNSRVTTNEAEIDALQADMATAQADILTNASGIADNATAITDAISTAAADATSKANAAETAAKAYTDTRETAITTAYTTAIATATAAQDEINELADVNITSVANGQFLRYDLGSTKWVNVTANTTMIAEGTKLYFTDARAQAAVADNISSAVAAEATARANADTALQNQIDFITSNVDAAALDSLTEIVAAFQTADGNLVTTVTANTTAINNEVTARSNADAALQTELNTTQTGAGLAASGAYAAIGVYDADTNATGGYYIGGATSLANADKLLDSALKAEELARISGDSATLSSARSYADTAADTAELNANSYTDVREADIITNYQDYADTAEADAITSANSYTDAREADIIANYQDYADQAEADAKAYTDTRETAITTAYQTYADTAEADAITSANSYTDGRETAITTAYQTYADQAEVDAKAYTDTRETAITTAYQTYADQAEVDAKAYTDTRETAITTAYQAADTTLQTQINTEKGRIDAILTASTADKDTFAEIVTFINSVDTTNDTALGTEITTRANADAALQAELDTTQAGAGLTAAGAYTAIGVYDADTNATGGYYIGGATSLANADKLLDSALKAEELARISGDSATLSSAQSYADQAEVDAKAYTDTRETAITSAYQAYADQAEVDAKAYTDTRETAITTAYTSAIATAVAAKDNTDEITEGSRLYFTDERAIAAVEGEATLDLTGALTVTGNSTLNDKVTIVDDGSNPLDLNRLTNTGDFIAFQVNSVQQGTIGVDSTNNFVFEADVGYFKLRSQGDTQLQVEPTRVRFNTPAYFATGAGTEFMQVEGGVDDAFETRFFIAEPTVADASITFPNESGTVALTSYVDQAEVDAKAYTDTRETAITTAYQTADTALDNAKVNKTSAQALHATDALRFSANTLSLYKGDGTFETVDLSLYVDDTNLARIVSGTMASNGIATFTRDDATSFTVDMSILLDDTNLSRIVSATWNTGDGVLTLTRNDDTTVTVDLDDRYSLTSHNHTLDSLSNTTITSNSAGEILKWNGTAWVNNTLAEAGIQPAGSYAAASHSHPYLSDTHDMTLTLAGDASGTATFTNMGDATLTVTVADDSHNHVISNVDGLQAALDAKADDATTFTAGAGLTGGGTLGANRTFNVGAGTGITVAADSVSVDTTWSDARYVQPADLVNFHSSTTPITGAQATTNASGTLTLTFSELSGAVHYNVYLNRMLLRPTEYSISGTSVIIAQGIVATDDEVEVAGLKLV